MQDRLLVLDEQELRNMSLAPKNERASNAYVTTDYSLFRQLKGNRQLNMVHVIRLDESILKYGMLEVDVIVNEDFQVIDGQNRLQAAKNAKSPVFYKIVNGYGLREARILNENMSKWNKREHLESYCELGNPVYIQFRDFLKEYKDHFGFAACEALLTLKSGGQRDKVGKKYVSSKYFEQGYLEIPDIEKSKVYADRIIEIKPFYKNYGRSTFVKTMISLFKNENFDHDEFIRKLAAIGAPRLEDCGRSDQYKFMIEDIYNFRRSQKVGLRY